MPSSVYHQVIILVRKNLLVMSKTHETIKSLIVPLLTFAILYFSRKENGTTNGVQGLGLFFVPISLISVTRQVVFSMVEEKQTKQKEIQKIMGVKQASYVIGWLLTNLIKISVVVSVFLLLCIPTRVFESDASFLFGPTEIQLIFGYILFGLASMAQSYFVSVFFSVPKTAGDIQVLFTVIGDFFVMLFLLDYVKENQWVVFFMALFPSTCFTRMIFPIPSGDELIKFTIDQAIYMLLFDTVFYFTLYLYFDQVLPNEYGTHKSPLFFLKCKKNNLVHTGHVNLDLSLPFVASQTANSGDIQEDTSSAIYHQVMQQNQNTIRSVSITNLSKAFGDVKAVDGLTLQIYESQILCLLGHNGAGKTTMISLVTGLIEKNEGQVNFYGNSIDTNLDDIRQMTGICVQKDVLYDVLSVEEHLRYYAQMKGFDGNELENEVQYILTRCVLQGEKFKLAGQLSGGNKRKLSLGIALIGKSKIVFLDEPTSGMDPVTRRAIWDILMELKQEQRTLILTTHHLDEAEILSERIAIMAHGKLLTVGSADFIKRNFGVGYHLNIFRRRGDEYSLSPQSWEDKKQQIKSFVLNQIQGSQYNPQTAEDTLTFLLPFQEKQIFIPLFKSLESDPSIQIDLAMTSLEEAFINIGMDQEKFMKKVRRASEKPNMNIQEENSSNQIDYTDFSSIPVPPCLYNQPTYSYWNQFKACFLRKYYTTKLGKKILVQILVPLYFEIIAVISVKIFKNNTRKEEVFLSFAAFMMTLELSFGMSMSAASIAGQPVQEREDKLKYALNVMGCRITPYWFATMVFDCLVSFSLIIILIIMLLSLGMPILATPSLCLVYFATQFAFVGTSYAVSWLYTKANLAYKTAFILVFSLFLLFPMILMLIVQKQYMFWFCAVISPIIAMFQAIAVDSDLKQYLAFNSHYPYIFIMILQGLAGLTLSIYIDTRSLRASNVQNAYVQQVNEQDVIDEAQRVQSQLCPDSVKTQNLSKIYSNGYSAVKGTSFGIDKGQVFGLLGPNGAGKSTTFNMITSRLKPTNGNVKLMNQEAEKGNSELYQNVGICPQFDCIWEIMTPVEHLKIFAMIKGLQGQDVVDSVEYFIRIIQLDEYRNTKAGNLSGGNKRKLCVAIALIGSPCMQFFDEPSSGVDPIARRFLWNTIQQGLRINSSAVVLTTHSMDEAESLCHKIGIQVNGQFVCMGSPQQLKTKYGSGYRITLDVIDQSVPIVKMVCERFPNCLVIDTRDQAILSFQFPMKDFSFYETFDFFLNTMQGQFQAISDFSIVQGTLEQVFMYFASFQEIRPEEVFRPKSQGLFSACIGNDEDD